MAGGWSTFDHTGDLGLEVWADSPEALYAGAAVALSAQIARAPQGETEVRCGLALEGDDPAELLVHWLNTSLLEGEIRHAVWTRARVSTLTPTRLSAELEGQRLDPARQVFMREVKAVSHHFLELDLESRPCRCRLILDL
jgi:SHS2 domain-containing protein